MTSPLPPLTQALTGALGGAASNVLTYPLDTLCARIQTSRGRNVPRGISGALKLLRKMAARDGWLALYGGLVSDTGATLLSK
jgi:adenine nucleotide transporter 17